MTIAAITNPLCQVRNLGPTHHRVVLVILEHSWLRETAEPAHERWAELSERHIEHLTGIERRTVRRVLRELVDRKLVIRLTIRGSAASMLRIQPDASLWDVEWATDLRTVVERQEAVVGALVRPLRAVSAPKLGARVRPQTWGPGRVSGRTGAPTNDHQSAQHGRTGAPTVGTPERPPIASSSAASPSSLRSLPPSLSDTAGSAAQSAPSEPEGAEATVQTLRRAVPQAATDAGGFTLRGSMEARLRAIVAKWPDHHAELVDAVEQIRRLRNVRKVALVLDMLDGWEPGDRFGASAAAPRVPVVSFEPVEAVAPEVTAQGIAGLRSAMSTDARARATVGGVSAADRCVPKVTTSEVDEEVVEGDASEAGWLEREATRGGEPDRAGGAPADVDREGPWTAVG